MTDADIVALTIGGLRKALADRGIVAKGNNKPALRKRLAAAIAAPPANGHAKPSKSAAARADRHAAILRLRKPDMSIRALCRAAEAAGIRTARGGKRWHTASMVALLG